MNFPASLTPSLPPLEAYGLLPPGDYGPTADAFEACFVGTHAGRGEVYGGWNRHRAALRTAGLAESCRQLLNGSFTTAKPDPGDIDIAVEVPITYGRLLAPEGKDAEVRRLLSGPEARDAFRCDAYPIYCLPEDDPRFELVTRSAIRYWTKWFGTTREGRAKGRVWATVGGLL
jgi:hypothetical protein